MIGAHNFMGFNLREGSKSQNKLRMHANRLSLDNGITLSGEKNPNRTYSQIEFKVHDRNHIQFRNKNKQILNKS